MSNCSRVILLLDLDCFYAQCEIIRLGLDPSVPLCLLQWNSALAVSYPAREQFGLKRGASFEEISKRSEGKCVALHLPVVSMDTILDDGEQTQRSKHVLEDQSSLSVEAAYEKEFERSREERAALFAEEKDRIRLNRVGKGKASLDRYRLASARIFDVILDVLDSRVGKGNFVLEKASIDELYIDVTDHCRNPDAAVWTVEEDEDRTTYVHETSSRGVVNYAFSSLQETTRRETVVCAKRMVDLDSSNEDEDVHALQRGCVIARGIRKEVFDRLGFTLSAGISTNKLMAKLCATHGKPNGQAVAYTEAVPYILKETKIRKTRNLGGKIGKLVSELLPEGEDTMGSISRLLSLGDLSSCLGPEKARMVWNYSHGVDKELVKETKGALTKSITSFKSFVVQSREELTNWIRLLSSDLFLRVDLDTSRNNRFPTTCTVQYYVRGEDGKRNYKNGKSVRVPFPMGDKNSSNRSTSLVQNVEDVLLSNCKDVTAIVRIGLCAVNFHERAKTSIGSYFCTPKNEDSLLKKSNESEITQDDSKTGVNDAVNELVESNVGQGLASKNDEEVLTKVEAEKVLDPDLAYAQKLQAKFDREDNILSAMDKNRHFKAPTLRPKRAKLEHFFKPKSKK